MNNHELMPPQPQESDDLPEIAKISISDLLSLMGVPMSGFLVTLLGKPFRSSYEKRRQRWEHVVYSALQEIQVKVKSLELLFDRELFTTVLIKAYIVAMQNHQQAKYDALKNAIVNCAISNIEDDLQLKFIQLINDLTPSHLKLIIYVCDNEKKLQYEKAYAQLHSDYQTSCDIEIELDEFKMLFQDLVRHALVRVSSAIEDTSDIYDPSFMVTEHSVTEGMPYFRITLACRKFIDYISHAQ